MGVVCSTEAVNAIDAVAQAPAAGAAVDRGLAAEHLLEHLRLIGVRDATARWVDDLEEGYLAVGRTDSVWEPGFGRCSPTGVPLDSRLHNLTLWARYRDAGVITFSGNSYERIDSEIQDAAHRAALHPARRPRLAQCPRPPVIPHALSATRHATRGSPVAR